MLKTSLGISGQPYWNLATVGLPIINITLISSIQSSNHSKHLQPFNHTAELLSPRTASNTAGGGGVWKFGVQKMKKIKILKIQIRSAQNVGKVWISRKKILPALFGAIWGHFFHRPEKSEKWQNFAYFPWWANGPYSPGLGPCCYPPEVGE